jgi:putative aminopeptidase FrvX
VVVRVGDRATIFDPTLTAALCARAAALDGLPWQRRLMDGGTCEASAFGASGWRASGLALPLGNYHNVADDGSGIAPEDVRVDDLLAEVRLLESLVTEPLDLDPGPPTWLTDRQEAARRALGAG